MDKTNVPEGSYTRQGIPLADALFRKPAVLRLSEDAQTEKESHTFNTATGVIFYTRALHTPHMRRRFLVLAQVGWGRGRCQNCTPNTRPTHERLHNKLLHNQYTTLYTNGMAPHWPGSSRRRRNALIFTRSVLLCCNKQQHTHRISERTHAPG